MKRALLTLLLLAIIGTPLVHFVLARNVENQQLLAQTQSELAAAREEVARSKAQLAELREIQAENARMKEELAELGKVRTELAKLKEKFTEPKPVSPAPTAQAPASQTGNALRKMLEAPGMREMMKKQQAAQVSMSYSGLMAKLQLGDEDKDAFQKLLGDRMAAQSDLGLKMMDSTLTPAQRQEIAAQVKAANDASDAAIRTFLNDDGDYQIFQNWQDTLPERMQMNMFGQGLFASSSEPLTPDQQEQLIGIMASARKASPASSADTAQKFDPAALTPAAIQQSLQRYDAQAQVVTQNAAAILSPAQLQILATMQSQIRSVTEAGLKMSASMFGGPQAK